MNVLKAIAIVILVAAAVAVSYFLYMIHALRSLH
jgi:hypothetical protein